MPVFGPASIALVTQAVKEGDSVALPGVGGTAKVMEVPGHTEEHIAFLYETHLFCGDTLFAGGCGRLLGSSTAAQLHASLQRIASLPDETQIHCAHEYTLSNLRFAKVIEPDNVALQARLVRCRAQREQHIPTLPSRLAEERATNPFLRTAQADVRKAVELHTATSLPDTDDVFAAMRAWKDSF